MEKGFPLFETRPRFVSPFVSPPHPSPYLRPGFTLFLSFFFLCSSHYTSFGRRPLTTGYFNWIFAETFFTRPPIPSVSIAPFHPLHAVDSRCRLPIPWIPSVFVPGATTFGDDARNSIYSDYKKYFIRHCVYRCIYAAIRRIIINFNFCVVYRSYAITKISKFRLQLRISGFDRQELQVDKRIVEFVRYKFQSGPTRDKSTWKFDQSRSNIF